MKALRGGKILTGRTWCEGKALLFDERIRDIVPESAVPSDVESVTEAEGAWVAPGFLDIHVHGVCGADTMDASSASLERIAEALTAHGVTAFCPTTMTMDEPHIDAALQAVHTAMTTPPRRGARVLGAHLEGPFLSRSRLGAQNGTFVRRPDPDFVRR
jgi:N-acetylglucosamine-6-phosphate deacetylase